MDFAEDITRRARWAIDHNGHQPNPAWSTGERLAVALVLGDDAYITAEGFTKDEGTGESDERPGTETPYRARPGTADGIVRGAPARR